MVLADLGRALALGGAALAGLLGRGLGLPALLVVAFTVGVLSVFFDVAYQASLVRLVARDRFYAGHQRDRGQPLGGADRRPRPGRRAGVPPVGADRRRVLRPVLRGVVPVDPADPAPRTGPRAVGTGPSGLAPDPRGPALRRRDTWLRTVGLASTAFQFSFAATMTGYLLFLPRDLHLSGSVVGVTLAATGPGALLGSVLAARLPGRFGHGVVLVSAAALGDGVMRAHVSGPSAVTIPSLVAVNFVFGTFGELVNVTVMAVRQAVTPDGMQGHVAATITFVGMGAAPLGSLFGGFLVGEWAAHQPPGDGRLGMMLSPALMALSPLARLGRELPPRDMPPGHRFLPPG